MPGKLGEGLKFKYEPIWPQAEIDMKFHYYEKIGEDRVDEETGEVTSRAEEVLKIREDVLKNFKLLKSIDELKAYIPLVKDKIIGFDTETTGLSYGEDKIVGFSLSLDAYSGFYVPIRHQEKLEVVKEVPKLDENGNPVILKSGRPSVKKETSYTLKESEENLNPKEALDVLYEILLNAKRVLMHNAEFDLNMLKFEGYDVNKIKFFDTLILPYIFDPEATGLGGLKALEKRVLGRTVPEFKEVLGKKAENFAFVAPSEGYVYACCDTSGVVGVFDKMFPVVKELLHQYKGNLTFDDITYNVLSKDNQMVQMFVDYYGHAKILIDKQKAIKYKEQLEAEQKQTIKEIYDYFDAGIFNLSTSSNEFKEVMYSKKVITGVKTDKGGDSWAKPALDEMRKNIIKLKECLLNWKDIRYENGILDKSGMGFQLSTLLLLYGDEFFTFGKESVNSLPIYISKKVHPTLLEFWRTVKELYTAEESKYNILMKIQRNNSLNKALNSYVDKLTQVDECIMHYRLKGTKSGRLSSGNGSKTDKSKNTYYIDLNAQNLTKPASAYYSATQTTMDDPEGVLGWKFKPVEKDYAMSHLEDEYIVEGQDPGITIRGCLKAPEGRYVVSLDYDAEEYLVLCLLSGDSKMYENFLNGVDPHTASAYAIWGEENYDKAKRKKAKIYNFASNYGGGPTTIARNLDIPVAEAQEMMENYNRTFHEMVEWKLKKVEEMYQNDGVVFSAFGRPRQFKGWINTIAKNSESYSNWQEKQEVDKVSNRVKSAIERRVSSHLIQGTCGDILRLVLYKLYKRYFQNRDPHIDFMSTVHDEVNYTIDKEVTVDYVRELENLMKFDCFDKRLPIKTSTDIGYTYGNMFPFVWEDESTKQVLIPKRVHHA